MTAFRVGDKVRRIEPGMGAMQPGTEWTISNVDDADWVKVEGCEGEYVSRAFKLIALDEPAEAASAEEGKPTDFELDFGLLRNAAGAPGPWASEMARLVRTVASVEFAAESFEPLLTAFSRQAVAEAKRSLALEVANQPVLNGGSTDVMSGALQFRNMLSERLLMESA